MTGYRSLHPVCFALALLLHAATLAAVEQPTGSRQQRFLIPLDTAASGAAAFTAIGGGRLPAGGLLHRFHVEIRDRAGRVVPALRGWSAKVHAAAAGNSGDQPVLAHLSAAEPEFRLPTLLGFRVDAADSIIIVATIDDPSLTGVSMEIVVDYDAIDSAGARWAVTPRHFQQQQDSTATISWEWRSDVTGRMVGLNGLTLADAASITLQDVQSGEVLWSVTQDGSGFRRATSSHRPCVTVVQGREYRVTATLARPAAEAHAVRAFVLPK